MASRARLDTGNCGNTEYTTFEPPRGREVVELGGLEPPTLPIPIGMLSQLS